MLNSVLKEAKWNVLQLFGVRKKLVIAVKNFYNESKACVGVESKLNEWFPH